MIDGGAGPQAERTAALEARLGHTFADRALLRRALTHRSATQEGPDAASYERLEFLGDAVLGALAAEWLYQQLAADDEGDLGGIRAGACGALCNGIDHVVESRAKRPPGKRSSGRSFCCYVLMILNPRGTIIRIVGR